MVTNSQYIKKEQLPLQDQESLNISPEEEKKSLESENTTLKTQLDLSQLKQQIPDFRKEIAQMAKPGQDILGYLETQDSYKQYLETHKNVNNSKKMVLFLQCALNQWGSSLAVDGSYGINTLSQLAKFSQEKGLKFDGSVTSEHLQALKEFVKTSEQQPLKKEVLPHFLERMWLDQSMLVEWEQNGLWGEKILEMNRVLEDREQGYINTDPILPGDKNQLELMRIDAQFLKSEYKEALLKKIDEVEQKMKEFEEVMKDFATIQDWYRARATKENKKVEVWGYVFEDPGFMERDSKGALKISKDGVEICTLSWYIGYKDKPLNDNRLLVWSKILMRKHKIDIPWKWRIYQYQFNDTSITNNIKQISQFLSQ